MTTTNVRKHYSCIRTSDASQTGIEFGQKLSENGGRWHNIVPVRVVPKVAIGEPSEIGSVVEKLNIALKPSRWDLSERVLVTEPLVYCGGA